MPDPPPGTSASILSTAHYIGMFIIGIPLIWCSHIINWCSKVCAWSIMPIMFTVVTFLEPEQFSGADTFHCHPSSFTE